MQLHVDEKSFEHCEKRDNEWLNYHEDELISIDLTIIKHAPLLTTACSKNVTIDSDINKHKLQTISSNQLILLIIQLFDFDFSKTDLIKSSIYINWFEYHHIKSYQVIFIDMKRKLHLSW